jgi:hypothetical protein
MYKIEIVNEKKCVLVIKNFVGMLSVSAREFVPMSSIPPPLIKSEKKLSEKDIGILPMYGVMFV